MSTLLSLSAPIPERIVKVSDGEGFAVRGLNPLNVVAIYRRHMGELEPLFERVMASAKAKGNVEVTDMQPVLLNLLSETPVLIGELIVVATGGDPSVPEAFAKALGIAMALPFTVQTDALVKIGELTFTQDMPAGNFFALVLMLLRKATGAMEGMISLAASQTGSGESVGTSTS